MMFPHIITQQLMLRLQTQLALEINSVETQKVLDKLEDASENEPALEKVRRKVSRARVMMRDKIESLNSDDSFEEVLRKVYKDLEQLEMAILK
jgi:hypothetical protein